MNSKVLNFIKSFEVILGAFQFKIFKKYSQLIMSSNEDAFCNASNIVFDMSSSTDSKIYFKLKDIWDKNILLLTKIHLQSFCLNEETENSKRDCVVCKKSGSRKWLVITDCIVNVKNAASVYDNNMF